MKIFFRIVVLNIIIGFILSFIIAPYSTPERMQLKDWLSLLWAVLYVMGVFFWIGYMFYHWGISRFKNGAIKKIWFWAMLFGGIPFYYIIVYEMGKGLKEVN